MQETTKAVIHLEDDGSGTVEVRVEGTGITLISLLVSVMQQDDDFKKIVQQSVFFNQKFESDLVHLPKNTKTFDA